MFSYLKSAHNSLWDRCLGVDTAVQTRPSDTSLYRDALKANAVAYGVIFRYVRLLRLQPSDVVYDIGCGAGRPLCVFARQNIARCIGIEMDRRLAEIARLNLVHLARRRCEAAVIQGDAALADYKDGSVFWLYNAFGPRTLAAVLERIRQSVVASPRQVRFCYVTPEAERAFSASTWLTRYKTVRPFLHPSCAASFWRN